jgi:hypothetical protein
MIKKKNNVIFVFLFICLFIILLFILSIAYYNGDKEIVLADIVESDLQLPPPVPLPVPGFNYSEINYKSISDSCNEIAEKLRYIPDWALFIMNVNLEKLNEYSSLKTTSSKIGNTLNLDLFKYYLNQAGIEFLNIKEILVSFKDITLNFDYDFVLYVKGDFNLDEINKKLFHSIENKILNLKYTSNKPTTENEELKLIDYVFEDTKTYVTFKFLSETEIIASSSNRFNDYLIQIETEKSRIKNKNTIQNISKVFHNSGIWIVYKMSDEMKNIIIDTIGGIKHNINNIKSIMLKTSYPETNSTNNEENKASFLLIIDFNDYTSAKNIANILKIQIDNIIKTNITDEKLNGLISSIEIEQNKTEVNLQINIDKEIYQL